MERTSQKVGSRNERSPRLSALAESPGALSKAHGTGVLQGDGLMDAISYVSHSEWSFLILAPKDGGIYTNNNNHVILITITNN